MKLSLTESQKLQLKNSHYVFYQDSAHGWLQIPVCFLTMLGIEKEISFFSYLQSRHAYLEQNDDLTIFIKALASVIGDREAYSIKTRTVYSNISPVRRMFRYTLPALNQEIRKNANIRPFIRKQKRKSSNQIR